MFSELVESYLLSYVTNRIAFTLEANPLRSIRGVFSEATVNALVWSTDSETLAVNVT